MCHFPETLVESPLSDEDLDDAEELVVEAGWNQTLDDWCIFRELGHAGCVKDPAGRLVATAAILPYEHRVGWIGMVLVTSQWRRRGIATRLLERSISELHRQGLTAGLDATPAGRAVYQGLGFHDHWPITRWRCRNLTTGSHALVTVRAIVEEDWPQLTAMDLESFGCNRAASLLRRLWNRSRSFACVSEADGKINGFLLGRDGRVATQFGPISAEDGTTAAGLVRHAARHVRSPILIDALDRHIEFAAWLTQQGFEPERPFTRMILGDQDPLGDPRRTIAIAGPELG